MKIAITGATGFVGRALVARLADAGHSMRCWYRDERRTAPLAPYLEQIDWIPGDLSGGPETFESLIDGVDAVVHAAYWRPGKGFRGTEGDLVRFAEVNLVGSLRLMQMAHAAGLDRFVFVSTCAVHEKILDDRPLDEAHPLWPFSHYGAHKAALEKFVHSFGFGAGMPICSLRPTGIYGCQEPVQDSKWFELVAKIYRGEPVTVRGGGKEVHVDDVAKGIECLLTANREAIGGESFACYDRYISEYDVASITRSLCESSSEIQGEPTSPRHEIETGKLRALGMQFGGEKRLRETLQSLVDACRENSI